MVTAANAKQWAFANIKGLWTSPLTVLDEQYRLDDEGLAWNVEYLLKLGVEGLGYGHSDPWILSTAERKHSHETFVRAVNGRVPCYLHAYSHSAPDTVDLVNHAAKCGADMVMIAPPYEWAKTEDHILHYLTYVAEHTDIAIILLNTPHSGRIMSPELLSRLADLDAVCALKNGINDFSLGVAHHRAIGHRIVYSHPREEEALPCIMFLKQQVQLGTNAVFLLQSEDWQPVRRYVEAAKAGQLDEAFRVWIGLEPLRKVWSSMINVLWTQGEHPIALTKAWMEFMGMKGGPVRPPMVNLSSSQKAEWISRVSTAWAATRAALPLDVRPQVSSISR